MTSGPRYHDDFFRLVGGGGGGGGDVPADVEQRLGALESSVTGMSNTLQSVSDQASQNESRHTALSNAHAQTKTQADGTQTDVQALLATVQGLEAALEVLTNRLSAAETATTTLTARVDALSAGVPGDLVERIEALEEFHKPPSLVSVGADGKPTNGTIVDYSDPGNLTALASGGVYTSDVYVNAEGALVFPVDTSHLSFPPGTPKPRVWGKTVYMAFDLTGTNSGLMTLWRYVPNGFWGANGQVTWFDTRNGYQFVTRHTGANTVNSTITADVVYYNNTKVLFTWAHSAARTILCYNGVHVGTSPRTQDIGITTPDETSTDGTLYVFGSDGVGEGAMGRLYDLRVYDGVHTDSQIQTVKAEMEASMNWFFDPAHATP